MAPNMSGAVALAGLQILLQKYWLGAMVRAMTNRQQNIDYCRSEAREHDPDRYYISLFAPAEKRPGIWALIAFNQEVAKTKSVVSEAMLGEIRLQWWRETLEGIAAGTPRAHPVAEALASATSDFKMLRPFLDEIIDTWSDDFGGGQVTLSSIEVHATGTGGALNAAMLKLLNAEATARDLSLARTAGKVWSLMGTLRALPLELATASGDWGVLSGAEGGGDEAVAAILPTTRKLQASIEADLDALKAAMKSARADVSLRTVLGLAAIATLEMRAVRRVGEDLMTLDRYLPGNSRKLLALMKYQFFG